MEFVKSHPVVGGTRVVVYGQSLGGAVALYVADKFKDQVPCCAPRAAFPRPCAALHTQGLCAASCSPPPPSYLTTTTPYQPPFPTPPQPHFRPTQVDAVILENTFFNVSRMVDKVRVS
jgi:hypothetical protein